MHLPETATALGLLPQLFGLVYLVAFLSLLVLFQGLILLTGNYGFFNLLTIVLCLPLLDDRYLAALGVPAAASPPASPLTVGLASTLFLLIRRYL